jgi:hypothetical protein
MKPLGRNISPADSYLVGFLAVGEGDLIYFLINNKKNFENL